MDEELAKSLEKLRTLTSPSLKPIDKVCPVDDLFRVGLADGVRFQLQRLLKEKVDVEDLALDFTIPGYDIELRVSESNRRQSIVLWY